MSFTSLGFAFGFLCSLGRSQLLAAGSVESGCAAVTLDSEPGLLHLLQAAVARGSPASRAKAIGPLSLVSTQRSEVSTGLVAIMEKASTGQWSLYKEVVQDNIAGGAWQALIFTTIFLASVFGIYWMACIPSEDKHDGRDPRMLVGRSHGTAGQLLSGRQMYPAMSQRPTLEAGSVRSLNPLNPPSSMRLSTARKSTGDNWYPELPTIYPPLVIPAAHTRLAVPVSPLFHDQFEVDVLGLSGVPLLTAALMQENGLRKVQISLHSAGTLLAIVTSAKEVFGSDGTHFGTLVQEGDRPECLQHTLRDRAGRPLLAVSTRQDRRDYKMTSISGGRVLERATAVRRPAGKLPAEHYEVVANPNVDAVLVMACFLAVLVFKSSPSSPIARSGAGRPSGETANLTGRFWGYRED
ncbi:unnamed protein product [Symbiodinium natans]|uniref:Uncharacterized protein n=1 Tax=Symbiodinium natans TaxID=878477 RepID=A0A812G5P0_9DINO|nr:unnamed protein product [Symbiodinium natans]